jgi:glyoxylase-like metal-dependent hydrolase (beta-lactamase superfamily II)
MRLLENFYQIGSPAQSHHYDASVYLVDTGAGLTLLDCGTPDGFELLTENTRALGYNPRDVKAIFGTHGHYDHTGAAARWKELSGCALYLHEADRLQVETGDGEKTSASLLYNRAFPPVKVDYPLSDGQVFRYPRCSIEVIHTPGHSPGSVCFVLCTAGLTLLIAGDTLWGGFSAKIGSSEADWRRSLDRLGERHFDLLSFGHTSPLLFADADARIAEMRRQFAVYYNPWFKPMSETFRF